MAKQTVARASSRKTKAVTPEVVEEAALAPADLNALLGVQDDESFVAAAGQAIRSFLVGLTGFLTTARVLEEQALATRDAAKGLKLPTSAEEDAAIQRFVKKTSADKRQVEDHWKITSLVSQFHRRLTARRAKAVDALEEANKIGNTLHNRYVEAERRRVAEEEERRRQEAEERARKEREAEVARLEAEAIAREAAMPELSQREETFVGFLLGGASTRNNPIAAARQAGYRDPVASAGRLMASPKIQKALAAQEEARVLREQAAAKQAAPVDYEYEEVETRVEKVGTERTTWAAELLDEDALIRAIVDGKHGIPLDVLMVNRTVLNDYARKMQTLIDRWPGVRAKKTTKLV
jgi:hypothetical protein